MENVRKGVASKKYIIDSARKIFNKNGINLTLDTIAKEMEISKGKITNHFSTKDNLFLGIVMAYEEQFQALLVKYQVHFESSDLQSSIIILSKIMDLQYEFRCGIIFINMLGPTQSDLRNHIKLSFEKNTSITKAKLTLMVKSGVLVKEVLEQENFNSFLFIYINMLTQWVVYYEMYEGRRNFRNVKIRYLKAIIRHSYYPFFMPKGRRVFDSLDFDSI